MHSGSTTSRRLPAARERGVVLWIVAASVVMILGMAALAIDLAALYVARGEAQRAADAAALAGAEEFVTSGYTSGAVNSSTATTLATQQAITVGGENTIAGQAVQVLASDVGVDLSVPNNPRVTVTAARTAARGNALPTTFARIFGLNTAGVSATATAEAYNPSGGNGPPVASECVKPWLIPDCDPDNKGNPGGVSGCTVGKGQKYWPFIHGQTGAIINPGPVSQGGVVGETVTYTVAPTKGKTTGKQYYP
ncbi:MAG: pilus assembly protein TadG-related protein, partial [Terriglobia bacterium]